MNDLKPKVWAVMLEHLKTKGYPKMTRGQIVSELKPMWIKLEEAGLIQRGWRYSQYQELAMHVALTAEWQELLNKK